MTQHQNVRAIRVESTADVFNGPPGVFIYVGRHGEPDGHVGGLLYMCPCGCEQARSLPFEPTRPNGPAWQWDGNRDQPTVTPSIRQLNGCKWHGFLKAGIWEPCSDSGA